LPGRRPTNLPRSAHRAACNAPRKHAAYPATRRTGERTGSATAATRRHARPRVACCRASRRIAGCHCCRRLSVCGCAAADVATGCGPFVVLRAELHHDLGRLGLARAGLAGDHDRLRALVGVQPEVALLRDVVRVRRQPVVFRGQSVLAWVGIIVGRGMNVRCTGTQNESG
jgi:hypothetical protein